MLGGLITGAFYGIALWNRKKIWRMAISGGFGFGFGYLIVLAVFTIIHGFEKIKDIPLLSGVGGTSAYITFGTIIGLFLGLGMYLAEKQNSTKEPVET